MAKRGRTLAARDRGAGGGRIRDPHAAMGNAGPAVSRAQRRSFAAEPGGDRPLRRSRITARMNARFALAMPTGAPWPGGPTRAAARRLPRTPIRGWTPTRRDGAAPAARPRRPRTGSASMTDPGPAPRRTTPRAPGRGSPSPRASADRARTSAPSPLAGSDQASPPPKANPKPVLASPPSWRRPSSAAACACDRRR